MSIGKVRETYNRITADGVITAKELEELASDGITADPNGRVTSKGAGGNYWGEQEAAIILPLLSAIRDSQGPTIHMRNGTLRLPADAEVQNFMAVRADGLINAAANRQDPIPQAYDPKYASRIGWPAAGAAAGFILTGILSRGRRTANPTPAASTAQNGAEQVREVVDHYSSQIGAGIGAAWNGLKRRLGGAVVGGVAVGAVTEGSAALRRAESRATRPDEE